ncbi:snaclec coagulation factor IX/factor X-binding protein subunit A-like [Pleurodeles waltl]
MMSRITVFIIGTLALTPAMCQMPPFFHGCCTSDWYQYAHSCYLPITGPALWKDAEAHCKELSGHLASVLSEEEDAFIYFLMRMKNGNSDSGNYWIGATIRYENNRALEKWADGSKWRYTNFGTNPPSPTSGTHFLSSSWVSGGAHNWKYSTETDSFQYICKDGL